MEPIGSFQTVSGRGILRSSQVRSSKKFLSRVLNEAKLSPTQSVGWSNPLVSLQSLASRIGIPLGRVNERPSAGSLPRRGWQTPACSSHLPHTRLYNSYAYVFRGTRCRGTRNPLAIPITIVTYKQNSAW